MNEKKETQQVILSVSFRYLKAESRKNDFSKSIYAIQGISAISSLSAMSGSFIVFC